MSAATTLRSIRRRAGLRQVDLAGRAGITPSVLSAYEHGRRQPGADAFLALVEAAGFEPTYARRLDDRRQGRRLADVLTLAEALPFRPRPMPRVRRSA
ncbi:MAG: helix-turn-helix domain-containing protein [Ilumatobacteraceae bacterium]